jgi:hypothetical protein
MPKPSNQCQASRDNCRWLRISVKLLAAAVAAVLIPGWWCGREANKWWHNDPSVVIPLAESVRLTAEANERDISTGSDRFDGEWYYVRDVMSVVGLTQLIQRQPDLSKTYHPAIVACLDRLEDPASRHFGTVAWEEDGAEGDDLQSGHAYLGYWNLALGAYRQIAPTSRFATRHDALTEMLTAKLAASTTGLIATYPGEIYPLDVLMVYASIGLHRDTTGIDYPQLKEWLADFRKVAIDSEYGLLYQGMGPQGQPMDVPRGSGSAFGSYLLNFVDPDFSQALYHSINRHLSRSALGFGAVREYPPGYEGSGDIDSGPVVLGLSTSGTGFAIGAAKQHDQAFFRKLYRTAYLLSAPVRAKGRQNWILGGSMGNAIILTMLTTRG